MSLRLGDLGGGQTRTWARPAGRRSPRKKTGEANDPSQRLPRTRGETISVEDGRIRLEVFFAEGPEATEVPCGGPSARQRRRRAPPVLLPCLLCSWRFVLAAFAGTSSRAAASCSFGR